MLARLVRELPADEGYLFEPKWDGFRCLAGREGDEVDLRSRHGRPFARYFPEAVDALRSLGPERWIVDGELLVVTEGEFDFAALMGRLHPAASRVRELAARTPVVFVAFDLLAHGDDELLETPFAERRARLEEMFRAVQPPLFVTPATGDRELASTWLAEFCGGGLDGVVAKHGDLPYRPGGRAMLKVKHERTADCVVAGLRVGPAPDEVGSLMLGLYDDKGVLEHVGVASGFSRAKRHELARRDGPAQGRGRPLGAGHDDGLGAVGRRARVRGLVHAGRRVPLPPPGEVRALAARPRAGVVPDRAARGRIAAGGRGAQLGSRVMTAAGRASTAGSSTGSRSR